HAVEERTPALERGRRRRARVTMTGERFGHETGGSLGIDFDPGKLLRRRQLGQLALEALLGDIAASRVEDADLVVEDQRAEPKRAERALEEDPRRARPGAIDAGEPRSNRTGLAVRTERASRRRGRRHRHAALSETIDDAPGGATQRTGRVVGES